MSTFATNPMLLHFSGVSPSRNTSTVTWTSEQLEDGQVGFRVGRDGADIVAEFVGLGTLHAHRSGHSSRFEPAHGADPEDVAKVKAGVVPALLRHLAGKLTLHGSAVAFGNGAIACVGLSGAGKSTAAAMLCSKGGGALLADDTLAIEFQPEGVDVHPTERVSWLVGGAELPTDARTKHPVAPHALAGTPTRLAAVCRLIFDPEAPRRAAPARLRGHRALAALLPTVIRFVVDEPDLQVVEAEHLDRLAACVPIYELRRRLDESSIAGSIQHLAALVRAERP